MSGVKGGRGGKRKGAGKKKGSRASHTLDAQKLRQYLIKKLLREAKGKKEKIRIIDKLVELAEAGNMTALKEALDRALGRATESVDLTSGGEKIYNWGAYGNNNNLLSKAVDKKTTRRKREVEGDSSSSALRKDDS